MRKILMAMRGGLRKLRAGGRKVRPKIAAFARAHGGKIAYYACVAVVLSAIAYAAEQYRADQASEADVLMLPAAELEEAATTSEAEPALLLPADAERLRAYGRIPEWNAGLGLWEAHAAVDYRYPEARVLSLSAGTVRTVGRSGVYGGFVEVESGEYLLRYASVSVDDAIEPGAEIAAGDWIGTADASMPAEAQMGPHLHLELYQAGEAVDFEAHAEKKQPAAD